MKFYTLKKGRNIRIYLRRPMLRHKTKPLENGDTFFFITEYGKIERDEYFNGLIDYTFMGIYRTRKEAEEARDKIKNYVKTLQK